MHHRVKKIVESCKEKGFAIFVFIGRFDLKCRIGKNEKLR